MLLMINLWKDAELWLDCNEFLHQEGREFITTLISSSLSGVDNVAL